MRPERTRLTARASRAARARLLIKADLGWVPGYPDGETTSAGVAWRASAGDGRAAHATAIDRETLHRATRALKELELRFGDVLEEIAPRAWRLGVERTLALLKPRVHESRGASAEDPIAAGFYPRALAAQVTGAPEEVRPLLSAAAWVCLPTPARFGPIARWVIENADVLSRLASSGERTGAARSLRVDRTALDLALLASEVGPRRIEPFVALLGTPALFEVPTTGERFATDLRARIRSARKIEPRPVATIGPALASLVGPLLVADKRKRARLLELIGALDLAHVADTWKSWWRRVDRCDRLAHSAHEGDRADLHALALRKAQHVVESVPDDLAGESLLAVLTRVLAWDEAVQREALRAVVELPAHQDGALLRLLFVEHWTSLATVASPSQMVALLRGFSRYLARTRGPGAARLAPWGRLLTRPGRFMRYGLPEWEILRDVAPAKWPLYFDALACALEIAKPREVRRRADILPQLLALSTDPAHIAALACALALPAPGESLLRVAFELAGGDPGRFAALATAIERAGTADALPSVLLGIAAVRRAWGDETASALVLDASDALDRIGHRLAVLEAIDHAGAAAKPTVVDAEAGWVEEYPAWLGEPLRALAAVDRGAERTARRLLGDDVRTASAVRREISHLERLAPSAGSPRIARRIDGLRGRLERGDRVSPARRARLKEKLALALRRAKVAVLEEQTLGALRARLPPFLGIGEAPAWLFERATLDKLAPIWSFTAPMRAVAIRLFQARAGEPPWDFRDAPENRAFTERLARSGIDVVPWLEGIGARRIVAANGAPLDLRLEDDPLEILEMGRHFSTCLSPSGFNYFSAFANAIDVNKRVLFARDERGAVAGRCLLALTATGGLLAFHPYAHDSALGFDDVVASFLKELAAAMGVAIVPRGEVPRLVAPDWYDDGPVDLGGRFTFLEAGSAFRAAIASATPADFLAAARAAFAPLPLGALTLPLLIELPELDARPELAVSLLAILEANGDVPLPTLVRAAELVLRAGHGGAISRETRRRLAKLPPVAEGGLRGWLGRALGLLIELSPSDALRFLRDTRWRGMRTWKDEHDALRLEFAARAYDALARPRMAAALRRQAGSGSY